MAKIQRKLFDSDESVSKGGRADTFWRSRPVMRSQRYNSGGDDTDVDQNQILRTYRLKGFEYGNWLSNNDRYDRLVAARDSLQHLAKIIGSKNLGLNQVIGIAFGARGNSRFAAHFEPDTFMINLTKEKGFGALAHEYGHALDYLFGTYIDQHKDSCALTFGRTTRMRITPAGGAYRILANKAVNDAITNSSGQKSDSYLRWEKSGKSSKSTYWFRRSEIFARIFEQWVQHQCEKKGIKNTFLAKSKYDGKMYLTDADFKRVLPTLNRLVREFAQKMNS